ncbi:hypothetical protein OROGR_027436 [Orobanche gracilis]
MTTDIVKEQNLEKSIQKQMGCMAGFLQIFDRHQFLTGKRFHSAKRLPPPPIVDSTSESEKSAPPSPSNSTEFDNPLSKENPATEPRPPPSKPHLPMPVFELKEGIRSSWSFRKETPRLSLDSRAMTDARGSLHPKEIRKDNSILSMANRGDNSPTDTSDGGHSHRSPSVIARLMGLEPLPNSSGAQPENRPELRRSASESRVSKDLFQSRFISDGTVFNSKQPTQSHFAVKDNVPVNVHYADPRNYSLKIDPKGDANEGSNRGPRRAPSHRKSFFNSGDIFPEPKQNITIYGEIEKRLKMRGIKEPSQDLDTLKQILEALQLKGLLHSKPPSQQNQVRHRNFVYGESPVVVMKPSRSPASTPTNRRMGNDYSPANVGNQARGGRRNHSIAGETTPSVSPRRERNTRSPTRSGRIPNLTTRSNSPVKPTPLCPETQFRKNESPEYRKASPVHSPKVNTRRTGPDPTVSNRLHASKKPTSEIHQKESITNVVVPDDESSSNSGSSITTTSIDPERSKADEYTGERNILERCDKLLHSIAEMGATDTQPSPVSVLDSFFYKDESLTPSPVTTKRIIDFKDQEEEIWSPLISPIRSKHIETSDDSDYIYISDVLRAMHYLPEDSNTFPLLEKQQYLKGHDTSEVARLHRKLIFDTIFEVLDRNRGLAPWNNGRITMPSVEKIWSEFERIREREKDSGEDLFETICSVLKRDLARDAINGWGGRPVETSEAVLDIERLIFKDLICDSIGDFAALASPETLLQSVVRRRKLVF